MASAGGQSVKEIFAGRDVIAYTEPFQTSNSFPSDNPWGTDPGSPWTNLGWTKDGVAVRWRQQIQTYTVDQSLDPLTALPLTRDLRFITSMGQIDMPAIVTATSSGSATGVILSPTASGTADYILQSVAQNLYYTIFFD